jgi:hypothetical protein
MLKYASLYGGQLTSLEEIKSRSIRGENWKVESLSDVGDNSIQPAGVHVKKETGFNKILYESN